MLPSVHILWSVSVETIVDCVMSVVCREEIHQPVWLLRSWVKNDCIGKQGDPVATLKAIVAMILLLSEYLCLCVIIVNFSLMIVYVGVSG